MTVPDETNGLENGPGLPGGFSLSDFRFEELDKSRRKTEGKEPREIRNYFIEAPADLIGNANLEGYFRTVVHELAPAEVDGLVVDFYEIVPLGAGRAEIIITYGLIELTAESEFDTTGGQARIRQSFGTRKYGTGPNFQGLINCHDGKVDGTDITIPVYSFSESRSFLSVPYAYRNTLFRLTGKVNNANFKGFAPYEVLFLGSRGRKVGRERWKIQFLFAASPNVVNLVMASGITVSRKDGWEYLWTWTEPTIDTTAGDRLVVKPQCHFVEKVYLEDDFAAIGIGVT